MKRDDLKKPNPNTDAQNEAEFDKNTNEGDAPAPVPGTTAQYHGATPSDSRSETFPQRIDETMRKPGQSQEEVDAGLPAPSKPEGTDATGHVKTDEQKDRESKNLGNDSRKARPLA